MKEKLIEVKNLNKSFGIGSSKQIVLDDLSFDIYNGDFTVIMGASGSGKSTLLYMLSGMSKPDSGNIYFGDSDITKLNNDKLAIFRRKNCGFIFQDKCLISGFNAMDNVLLSGYTVSNDKEKVIDKARELFEKVGITEELQYKLPYEMSGGIAQRVAIVRALITSPKILFADEPTGALNSQASANVLNIFNNINNEEQSIILVTHDIKSACRGNRIIYLKDGKIAGEYLQEKYQNESSERINKLKEFLNGMGW